MQCDAFNTILIDIFKYLKLYLYKEKLITYFDLNNRSQKYHQINTNIQEVFFNSHLNLFIIHLKHRKVWTKIERTKKKKKKVLHVNKSQLKRMKNINRK